jgi:hypothetical protein
VKHAQGYYIITGDSIVDEGESIRLNYTSTEGKLTYRCFRKSWIKAVEGNSIQIPAYMARHKDLKPLRNR